MIQSCVCKPWLVRQPFMGRGCKCNSQFRTATAIQNHKISDLCCHDSLPTLTHNARVDTRQTSLMSCTHIVL